MQKNQPMPALKAGNTEKKRGDLPMEQEYLPGDTPQQRLQDLMKEYKITQAELAFKNWRCGKFHQPFPKRNKE